MLRGWSHDNLPEIPARDTRAAPVRLVFEDEQDYPSQWAAIRSIAEKSGMTAETQGSLGFLRAGARPATAEMTAFIDTHKAKWGVEPICKVLPITPGTYYAARKRLPSVRALRDDELKLKILRVWDENYRVYGDKIWAQLNREKIRVARCTAQRLMRERRGSKAPCGASATAPRSPVTTPLLGPLTSSNETSARRRPTVCGCATSSTCDRGRASSTSAS